MRVSTANMNCVRIRAQFPANPEEVGHDVTYELEPSSGSTAFGVMDGHTHASITLAPDDHANALEPNLRRRSSTTTCWSSTRGTTTRGGSPSCSTPPRYGASTSIQVMPPIAASTSTARACATRSTKWTSG